MKRKLIDRWRCHGSFWCCQYLDDPQCNSARDPHGIAFSYAP